MIRIIILISHPTRRRIPTIPIALPPHQIRLARRVLRLMHRSLFFLLLPHALLMSLLAPFVKLGAFVPLLRHFLPLADRTLDTEGGDADARGVLQAGFVFEFLGFFGGHFASEDELVAFVAGFDGAVDAVGGVDGGDGSEAGGKDYEMNLCSATQENETETDAKENI